MNHEIQTPSAAYTFTLYPADSTFYRRSGLYIFIIIPVAEALETSVAEALEARHPELVEGQPFSLLYIGITNNFQSRLKQHHKIQAAINLGMTHIGILKISSGKKRKKIEREILKHLNPPLNQTWLNDILH